MEVELGAGDAAEDLARLFAGTFAASEGAAEGRLIGALAADMLATVPAEDLLVVWAREDGMPVGCILFSRMRFEGDAREVFVLAPVAVAPGRQGRGIGQGLIRRGLEELRSRGADVALTYGDPGYYGRVGFLPISEAEVPAPFALNHPEGWLGQSLTARPLGALPGPSHCVGPLNRPEFW